MSWERIKGEHASYMVESDVLSKGGVGSIHRTTDPRWVFKRYLRPDTTTNLRHLRQLVEIGRAGLVKRGTAPGQTPESSVNWPIDVAFGRGKLVKGVVLPAIPPALFNEFGKPRGLEFLVMARAHPPSAKVRVALLLRMAEILAFVNARGLVHGDVNGKNLAWTGSPSPVMYLFDCDGMVPQDPPPTVGVQSLGWTDPRVLDGVVPAHDHYSDWYALGLAMYRGLLLTPGKLDSKTSKGKWPAPSKIPRSLSPRIAKLLHRALDDPLNAHGRPSPREWADALVAEYLPGTRWRERPLAILDKVSTDGSGLAPLQDNDGTVTRGRPRNSPARTTRVARAPASPKPPAKPVPVQPPGKPVPAKPAAAQPTPRRRQRPAAAPKIGRFAERALKQGPKWHMILSLACLFVPYVALPYIAIAWVQLRKVNSIEPRLTPTRKVLKVYGAIAEFSLIVMALYLAIRYSGLAA
ncbi:MAG: hypothetical protein J2P28_14720, partial [Actinobacteria bacterium]|nr:hypothetical protein [Actinomycetota bacterium]